MQKILQDLFAWLSEIIVGSVAQTARVMKHRTGSEMITAWVFSASIIAGAWIFITHLQIQYQATFQDDMINIYREREAELRSLKTLESFKAEFPEADLPEWASE